MVKRSWKLNQYSRGPIKKVHFPTYYDVIFLAILEISTVLKKCIEYAHMGIINGSQIILSNKTYAFWKKSLILSSRKLLPGNLDISNKSIKYIFQCWMYFIIFISQIWPPLSLSCFPVNLDFPVIYIIFPHVCLSCLSAFFSATAEPFALKFGMVFRNDPFWGPMMVAWLSS